MQPVPPVPTGALKIPYSGQYTNYVECIADGRPDGFHFSATAAVALITNWLGPIVLQAARGTAP
jgi:hypothetical protein